MLYGELKKNDSGNIGGAYRTTDAMIQGFKAVFANLTDEIEFLEEMRTYIIENMRNYGLGLKTEEQCKKITEQTKKEIMEKYNVKDLEIPALGIK